MLRLRKLLYIGTAVASICFICVLLAFAQDSEPKVVETNTTVDITLPSPAAPPATGAKASSGQFDPLTYTLGPDDVVEILVMRHDEFSGIYPINGEGKLQYKFVGDMDVKGMTKKQLEDKIKEVISSFVIAPEVAVTIKEYKSKVFYVLGEVQSPGKYYMRADTISARDAAFLAGLPNYSAAMRKCQVITPNAKGQPKIRHLDLYAILYNGNLKKDIELYPGDVLYVPSTIMAKVVRVINPVTSAVGVTSAAPNSASAAKTSAETLVK